VNPTVLVEVLNDRTAAYDLGEKFDHYRQIPTLQVYMLVSHDERSIETRHRNPDGTWIVRSAARGEVVRLEPIGIEFGVDEIYDRSPSIRSL